MPATSPPDPGTPCAEQSRLRRHRPRLRTCIGHQNQLLPYPAKTALYPISVRRVRSLPPASFPRCLATPQLPWARGSAHYSPQGTSTPSSTRHVRRTKTGRGIRSATCSFYGGLPNESLYDYLTIRRRSTATIPMVNKPMVVGSGIVDEPTEAIALDASTVTKLAR